MIRRPCSIRIDEPFGRVWELFVTRSIRHLPVVDSETIVRGLITQRDLYRIVSPHKDEHAAFVYTRDELDSFILRHVMIKDVTTIAEDETLGNAITIMVKRKFGCLPVTDDAGRLKGIITQTDILRKIQDYFL